MTRLKVSPTSSAMKQVESATPFSLGVLMIIGIGRIVVALGHRYSINHGRLLKGGQPIIISGTEIMEWHQTHGNHVSDVQYLITFHLFCSSYYLDYLDPVVPN